MLAGLLKCPVYYLFCIKQDNRHRIVFERAGDALSWRREQRDAAVRQAACRYAQRLQTYTVSAPLQWFNFTISGKHKKPPFLQTAAGFCQADRPEHRFRCPGGKAGYQVIVNTDLTFFAGA